LAKTGIEERRLVFDSMEVHGIENCGLFNRMPDSEITWLQFRSHFCFIHLTFQELLAAREITKLDPSDLRQFITLNASDPKWHMVIQFVAGLLHGQENEAVNSFVSLLHDSLTEAHILKNETKTMAVLMMKCLHGYNDEGVVEKAASELQKDSKFIKSRIDLSQCQVTPADCTAITFFIKHLHDLTGLNVGHNSLTDQGVLHLCDALIDCKLTRLNLADNGITDQGVLHLCDALINCELTQLNLAGNGITDQGVLHLCDALINCKLTQLNLAGNGITDQGVLHLRDALIDCALTQLDLAYNRITDQGVLNLCGALINCKLTQLNLTYNRITDQGVLHLCDALINCELTQLNLAYNRITDQGVLHLCDALINCELTQLNLAGNGITDQGVLHLCTASKDANWKLTQLKLEDNCITDHCLSHIHASSLGVPESIISFREISL